MNAKTIKGGYKFGKVLVQALGGTQFRVLANDEFRCGRRIRRVEVQLLSNGYVVMSSHERFGNVTERDAFIAEAIKLGAVND